MSAVASEYADFVASRAKRMGSFGADLLHATVGMMGEAVELRQSLSAENTRVELGDFAFYAMHYRLAWGWHGQICPEPQYPPGLVRLASSYDGLVDACGELLDLTKKIWVYNKPVDDELRGKISLRTGDISAAYRALCELVSADEEAIIEANMAKLRERFPDGYSDAAAQRRADDANWGKA